MLIKLVKFGIHASLEEIIVAQGVGGHWLDEVRRLARAAGVKLRVQERAALDRACGTPHHQGIMARRGAYVYRSDRIYWTPCRH